MVSFQADSQIVAGEAGVVLESGSSSGRRVRTRRVRPIWIGEGSGFGFAEGAEFAGAALDDGWGTSFERAAALVPGRLEKEKTWR